MRDDPGFWWEVKWWARHINWFFLPIALFPLVYLIWLVLVRQ